MEIYQLKTFVTIAREGTITRAADILCLSAPAVSAHIKALEDESGVLLFERNARGMNLTDAGAKLLVMAEKLLSLHRDFLVQARQLRDGSGGTIRLGSNRGPSALLLGRLLTRFAETCPDIDVHLQYGSSIEIEQAIAKAELDAGFFADSGNTSTELMKLEVDSFGVYLAAPPGWIAPADSLDWAVLSAMPWICPAPNSCCGNVAEQLFLQRGFRPQKQINVDHEKVTRSLIAGGVGLGFLHADTAREAQEKGEVMLLGDIQRKVPLFFAVQAKRQQEHLIAAVLNTLREIRL